MSYQNFVYITEELHRKKAIRMQWGECEVSFKLGGNNDTWKVQSSISQDPQITEDMQVLKSLGVQNNPCIRFNESEKKELLFVKEFQKTNRYTLFRQFMKKYLEEAKSWKLALDLEEEE
ncbi:MAG: hypothetical protein ACOYL1_04155 [Chlamydiia bacterium]|jgi:hypothetical protein